MKKILAFISVMLLSASLAWAGHQGEGVQNCTECHVPNLINEHGGFTSDTCMGCHASVDPAVINTITIGAQGGTVFCFDCHEAEPHLALHGDFIDNWQLRSGVRPGITPEWMTVTDFTVVDPATQQYHVCFLCHSSYGLAGSGGFFTDQAIEFNTANDSFHWVEGDLGSPKAEYGNFNMNLVFEMMPRYTGFNDAQLRQVPMRCSDCHEFIIQGDTPQLVLKVPAGSPYTEWTPTSICTKYDNDPGECTEPIWCFNCHDPQYRNTGFFGEGDNLHLTQHSRKGYCMDCHIKIPHGWQVPHLLKYQGLSTSSPYQGGSSDSGIDMPINDPRWNRNRDWDRDKHCGSHQNCDGPT